MTEEPMGPTITHQDWLRMDTYQQKLAFRRNLQEIINRRVQEARKTGYSFGKPARRRGPNESQQININETKTIITNVKRSVERFARTTASETRRVIANSIERSLERIFGLTNVDQESADVLAGDLTALEKRIKEVAKQRPELLGAQNTVAILRDRFDETASGVPPRIELATNTNFEPPLSLLPRGFRSWSDVDQRVYDLTVEGDNADLQNFLAGFSAATYQAYKRYFIREYGDWVFDEDENAGPPDAVIRRAPTNATPDLLGPPIDFDDLYDMDNETPAVTGSGVSFGTGRFLQSKPSKKLGNRYRRITERLGGAMNMRDWNRPSVAMQGSLPARHGWRAMDFINKTDINGRIAERLRVAKGGWHERLQAEQLLGMKPSSGGIKPQLTREPNQWIVKRVKEGIYQPSINAIYYQTR